ncbi:microprocessor complex subunit DGCR8-like [Mercenaria mercenaria]|uniref:microprocessor complex subunit DGCR8-like n=1 Tax=Mercenaria mercenaria TaxID=6596 RepID=UPI00234EA9E6|nr:microprocessor complex subunit DGCR8-like [Mercenaria mercenaria]XP_053375684.1 microprocessor complex subunit DGCR8-like [Mercenaria mercenaria]
MENDTSELFNTEALSFDSTLDSLMDVDYVVDEKALPFNPPSFNPPSEVLMSAQNSFRADIGHNDGGSMETADTGKTSELVLEKEVSEPVLEKEVSEPVLEKEVLEAVSEKEEGENRTDSSEKSKECIAIKGNAIDTVNKELGIEELEKGNDQTVQINIEIKERVANVLREPSPNFDQIKAKRKKNLAKKKPTTKDNATKKEKAVAKGAKGSNATKCPIKHATTSAESNIVLNNIEENVKEPPLKKMRISSEGRNENEITKTEQKGKSVNDSNGFGKVTSNETEDTTPDTNKIRQVSISEHETLESKQETVNFDVVSEVGKRVESESDKNADFSKEKEPFKGSAPEDVKKISNEPELHNETEKQSILAQPNEQKLGDQTADNVTEETVDKTEEVLSIKDKMESENETEDDRETDYVNPDQEDIRESDMDNGNEDDEEEEIEDEKAEYEGDDDDEFDDEDDVDDDEIHNWLEEGLTKEEIREKTQEGLKDGEFISNEKYILQEKGVNPFEMLPAGWIALSHNCGMPVYLHKESRVCTFSRPYYIGSGSSRSHEVPISSIPCLQYRRELEKEKMQEQETAENTTNKENEEADADENPAVSLGKEILPKPVIKSADVTDKTFNIAPKELNKYCRGLFSFRVVTVKKFKTWREKRAHMVEEKKRKAAEVPRLAPETKLLTCPIPAEFTSKKSRKKEFVLNPEGKTAVSILHEYTQNVLRVQPTYEFKEMSNADLPFQATVLLNGMKYGSGTATGKRQAKNEGAKATLEILVPELAELWNEKNPANKQKNELNSDLKFFETVAIEDPRVPELCVKSSLPQPYQVLHTCLQRNYGLGDTSFKVDKKMISNQKTEFTLTVGKRTCTVVCKNKREAKQKASQSMLQQLHPLLKNWAAILRLYSKNTEVGFDERKDEFPEQNFQLEKKKNFEILGALKNAMRKVREQRKNFSDGSSTSVPAQPPATLDL